MIGAVLRQLNKPLTINKLVYNNLTYGQVLISVKASGICGRQIQEINGSKGPDKFLPHLMGHEGGGIVLKVGSGVSKVKIGDHVVMHWRVSKGIESQFPTYLDENKTKIGGGLVTTFNSEAIVSENRITKISKEIPFKIGALLGCSLTTALGLVNNEAKIKIGQSVMVIGCGSVGTSVIQALKMVSAYPIVSVDISNEKLKFSKKFGSDHLIFFDNNFDDNCKSYFGSLGPDVIIETSGSPDMISKCYSILAPKGKLIMVGQPKFDQDVKFMNFSKNFSGKQLFDSTGGKTSPDIDIPRYERLIKSGKIDFEKLITNFYNIKEVNLAINDIVKGKTLGKSIIKFE